MTTATATSPITLFNETALNAGYQLVRDAIWDGNACNWIGANLSPVNGTYQVTRNSCSDSLYSGLAGIALFLARLSEEVKEPMLEETLEGAMEALLNMETSGNPQHYGYFGGRLGVADTLMVLGEIKRRPEWVEEGWKRLHQVIQLPPGEDELDIISGVAGAIPVLLRRFEQSGDRLLQEAAEKCGRHLLNKAIRTPQYFTWITLPGNPGLTGYSHGNTGIGLALLELYRLDRNPEWLQAARMAFQYESLHFDPKMQNWPDLRVMPGAATPTHTCAEAWCHGAPGMALARLRAWQITGDAAFLAEARTALHTTLRGLHHAQNNYSLCHGIAGNADVLFTAGIILQDVQLTQAAYQAGSLGIERYAGAGLAWPAGVSDMQGSPTVYENPSLMLGLAGTGYFYLRLANPTRVPSVMLVA